MGVRVVVVPGVLPGVREPEVPGHVHHPDACGNELGNLLGAHPVGQSHQDHVAARGGLGG